MMGYIPICRGFRYSLASGFGRSGYSCQHSAVAAVTCSLLTYPGSRMNANKAMKIVQTPCTVSHWASIPECSYLR